MPFRGGPLDGQPVDPHTLGQAADGGMANLDSLSAGIPGGAGAPPPSPSGGAPMIDPSAIAPDPMGGAAGGGGTDPGAGDMGEGARLDRILSDMLAVAGGGTLSQSDKSSIQKAMTLVQDIKAREEKEQHDALGGKMSPRLLSKAYGG